MKDSWSRPDTHPTPSSFGTAEPAIRIEHHLNTSHPHNCSEITTQAHLEPRTIPVKVTYDTRHATNLLTLIAHYVSIASSHPMVKRSGSPMVAVPAWRRQPTTSRNSSSSRRFQKCSPNPRLAGRHSLLLRRRFGSAIGVCFPIPLLPLAMLSPLVHFSYSHILISISYLLSKVYPHLVPGQSRRWWLGNINGSLYIGLSSSFTGILPTPYCTFLSFVRCFVCEFPPLLINHHSAPLATSSHLVYYQYYYVFI
ncbi:hypothetical protein JAAARDRAFT_525064 [Jaapia argillacea MUCL 33604]|uniref:Uncharacterized protein n=1 Tax=Jaapia argillacea MUCL 33604 TaxID=933084 RepID=A0A067Q4E5_9AGAM|nr:hypothetical protein JAAARDRAFT_525064 [Jaapia argillacea MUCL 33604]